MATQHSSPAPGSRHGDSTGDIPAVSSHHDTTDLPASSDTLTSDNEQHQGALGAKGKLRPFRLLREDVQNIAKRYASDWTLFNQQVVASAVYIFFTNILPGITFASDLFVQTGQSWGTIEIVFSTGLCGLIFAV
jgi:hypothetical protein